MSKIYGYARVSTTDQKADRQLLALEKFGVLPKDVFTDRQSGKDFERPQYQRLLKRLRSDDVLVVKSIDRLV
jgi:DNA invertase Pin-like site-specific DNA recombinase